ncbi:ECF transporter S component [Heyndrickxia sporothermodurans]|uniref:Riboflavin transporter n=2 Tax=Heyndrickxia sporothermodurans TaxID=46224 RepID=A0AB37H8M2_9BACI|nr:ECF transporter S component [Heyndrickxia sporothermodurans]MBL5768305.1 ECF transporter S component [Heyndrickxia sporothermodurans]MBL5771947.1 ECF transporter S component [Heyndrickxia sporothermodurans]MBL5775539.1 ECF transporter S component [Heyndrickxia sporothermodurans]MBL5780105.1 ECF transporter S component [Heyndrickxia sporothermodurans]MBL5782653.1 ECF transporter S component [Heyndrickxia sporothermodurans]
MRKLRLKEFVGVAMLSSVAYVLMFIKFPVLPVYSYLTVDFSDIPALIAALIFGPIGAIIVEVIKNLLDYLTHISDVGIPIGNVANLIAGLLFVLPTYFVYNRMKTKIGMTFALIIGTIIMAVLMSVLNYIIILPAYLALLHIDVGNVKDYIVAGILPFNLIKGALVTIIFMLIFAKMQKWINKQAQINNI